MVYLDHNASSPLDPRVLEAMLPYLHTFHGNPASLHRLGRISRSALDRARQQVAALVGADPAQIVFTAGGTEANNLAIHGMASAAAVGSAAVGATEHPSVAAPMQRLRQHGWTIQPLAVDAQGALTTASLDRLPTNLRFASVMLANNETGVVQAVTDLAERLRQRGAWLHCDAVQLAGKLPLNFRDCGAHLLSLSAHKLYGPKGAGALVVDSRVPLTGLLAGGGQERDLRSGTENVAALVGFGKAAELALAELDSRRAHTLALRQQLEAGLSALPGVTVFASSAERLPNTVQFGLAGIDGEMLLMALDRKGYAVSSGSACASGAGEPSPVLLAMGVDADCAKTAIRVSLGQSNQPADIAALLDTLRSISGR